jgi:dihydroxy-acid dehydratase
MRRLNWVKPSKKYKKGVLSKYSRIVSTSSLGAVTDLEE